MKKGMVVSVKRMIFCVAIFLGAVICLRVNGQGFKTQKTSEGIRILEQGKEVLFYQVNPKSVDGKFERSGYVHPLYGLNGELFTEDGPADHPYHRGIFWAWHQVMLDGKNIADGWVSENISWEVAKVTRRKYKGKAIINAVVLWKCFDSTSTTTKTIIKETTTITVNKSSGQYRQINFSIHLQPLMENIALGGSADAKGYGGFCVRLRLPDDISFSSASGMVVPTETAVDAAAWMKFAGTFDSVSQRKSSFIIMLGHDNPDQKQKWILRKKNSMQNVVFPGSAPQLLPRDGWKLQYKLVLCKEDLDNKTIEQILRN